MSKEGARPYEGDCKDDQTYNRSGSSDVHGSILTLRDVLAQKAPEGAVLEKMTMELVKKGNQLLDLVSKPYIEKGFSLVPFEMCAEDGDETIMMDRNKVVVSRGIASEFGANSKYAIWKREGLSDEEILTRGLAEEL